MKVKDLPDWPPSNFGTNVPRRRKPTHAGQVTIGDVQSIFDDHVSFTCKFQDQDHMCDFYVRNIDIAKKIEAILNDHKGENLLSIEQVDIP